MPKAGAKLNNRETELDLLRILAILAVITVHAMNTDGVHVSGFDRGFLTVVDCCITWEIPAFVMISGRFFLDPARSLPAKKLIQSIVRLVIAFVVWDIIYQIFYLFSGTYQGLNWKGIAMEFLTGPYHFWFLFMLVFLYAITPFLRRFSDSRKLMRYFILLFFTFESLTIYGTGLPVIGSTIESILNVANFNFALGFSGYFVIGFYLYRYRLSEKEEQLLYCAGVICLVFGIIMTFAIQNSGETFIRYLCPNIIIESAAIYYFFINRVSRHQFGKRTKLIISKLSEYSFGVYLVHALILDLMRLLGINPVIINPIVMLPLIVIIAYVISNCITALIRCIPVIGKKLT